MIPGSPKDHQPGKFHSESKFYGGGVALEDEGWNEGIYSP